MRLLATFLTPVIVLGLVFLVRPYFQDAWNSWQRARKYEQASQYAHMLATNVKSYANSDHLNLYVRSRNFNVVFEGSVPSSSELVRLSNYVQSTRREFQIEWRVAVSNTP